MIASAHRIRERYDSFSFGWAVYAAHSPRPSLRL
jgi:hypothetical protein